VSDEEIDAYIALYGVGPGLVHGLAGGDVGVDLFI